MSNPMTITQYVAYIGNEWAAGWLQRSLNDRKGVFVAQPYMHMVKGNAYDALLLSQIMYWSDINQETLRPRISHHYKNHLWIVKTHQEWASELGINGSETIKKSFNRLINLELVIKEQHRSPFHNQVVSYVRINWDAFSTKLQQWVNQANSNAISGSGKVQETQPGEVSQNYSGEVQENQSGQVFNTQPYTENTTQSIPENNPDQEKENPLVAVATDEPAALDEIETAIAKEWQTTSRRTISEIRMTLMGEHPNESVHYESNVTPPVTVQEIQELGDFYRHMYPGGMMPTTPHKIQDWMGKVRENNVYFLIKDGYIIELLVDIPVNIRDDANLILRFLQRNYRKEAQRVKSLIEMIDEGTVPYLDVDDALVLDAQVPYQGKRIHVPGVIPLKVRQQRMLGVIDYLEENRPDILNYVYDQMESN